jgi:phosphoadenosine phosphosulfate reductase
MTNVMKLKELSDRLSQRTISENLSEIVSIFPGKVIFTTSFGTEDQVLTHIIFKKNIPIEVVTLDTGRLFPETYKLYAETLAKYGNKIKTYFPSYLDIEKMVNEKGPYSFYDSKENRMECCRLRKVVPLKRALAGKECWITGIRAAQSDNRSQMRNLEYDEEKQLFKYHPLFDWSSEDVENFIKDYDVPYNSLHDKGYLSIGCEPCTRAVIKGQDYRSGRWWWENDGPKECGCHININVEQDHEKLSAL